MRQTKRIFAALGAAMAAAFAVSAEDVDDSGFLLEALRTDIAEMRMGELAAQRATSNAVRDYGKKLQADHARSLQESSALAKTLGVKIPTEPSAAALEQYDALAKLSGPELDAAFVNHMIAGHKEAIAKYGEQTHANPNKEISNLASKTLPTLQEHLAMAESLQTTEARGTRPDPHLRHEGETSTSSR